MEIRRFYAEDLDEATESLELRGEEFLHLKRVLRLAVGERVILLNGRGMEAEGPIAAMTRHGALIRVEKRTQGTSDGVVRITLIQGLLKGEAAELVAEKAVELGVSELRFFTSSRTVTRALGHAMEKKACRLKKVSIAAMKQCERTMLPMVGLYDYRDALDGLGAGLRLMLSEREEKSHIRAVLEKNGHAKDIALLVGPEGGLTDEEMDMAARKGFVPVRMGPRRLRSETAAIAALAVIGYALGDTGVYGAGRDG